MRFYKLIFITLFPVLVLLCIIQQAHNTHVSLRNAWNYTITNYDLVATDFYNELQQNITIFENFDFNLPQPEELENNNWLQNIWAYIQWFFNVIYQGVIAALTIINTLFNSIVLLLRTIFVFVRSLFYLMGIIS